MMKSEKNALLPSVQPIGQPKAKGNRARHVLAGVLLLLLGCWALAPSSLHHPGPLIKKHHKEPQCPQVDPIVPELTSTRLQAMEDFVSSSAFRNDSITRLSNAVQIPSVSYDDLGPVGEDKRWEIFYAFEAYLAATFPLAHLKLEKEVVNTHGLVYTWQGTDSNLKPTLLMAHQDVVPVPDATLSAWTHPPFSGFYDGKYVWGRGASDCKNQLVAIMEAMELLLAADFAPKRTIILSFGFDEEISGREGAGSLAPYILDRYGKDSIAAIVDEGSPVVEAWGSLYAAPAVAEKGYTDVTITVRMPGGHSSIPPAHTSIGVLSELITLIEEHLYSPRLDDKNPFLGLLQCGAEYSPDFPSKLKHLLSKRDTTKSLTRPTCGSSSSDPLAEEAAKQSLATRYLMQTSQAVDIISGGAKVNALPERVSAIVNHRINIGERPKEAQARLAKLAKYIAKEYDLSVHAFDDVEAPNSIMLSASNTTLEPAPVTPTTIYAEDSDVLTPWGVLSGTTRALYGKSIHMAPGLSTGNTDTRYYWDLSRHIFRYGPGYEKGENGLGNIHTVDEKQSVVAHVNAVKWFGMFVRNMDEAKMA